MNIAILGAGNVGLALAQSWLRAGHHVTFGIRGSASPELSSLLASNSHAATNSLQQAVQSAEVIVAALPWPAAKTVLQGLDLEGKILLDCTNPLLPNLAGIEVGTTTSGGEQIAQSSRGARVVKIFNTTGANNMADPIYENRGVPMFYCGDDTDAKQTGAQLARDAGFDPIDAGPLTNARLLEPLAMLWIWLAYPGGMGRDFAFQIVKR